MKFKLKVVRESGVLYNCLNPLQMVGKNENGIYTESEILVLRLLELLLLQLALLILPSFLRR